MRRASRTETGLRKVVLIYGLFAGLVGALAVIIQTQALGDQPVISTAAWLVFPFSIPVTVACAFVVVLSALILGNGLGSLVVSVLVCAVIFAGAALGQGTLARLLFSAVSSRWAPSKPKA